MQTGLEHKTIKHFSEFSTSEFAVPIIASQDLLTTLRKNGLGESELGKVNNAINLMFHLHANQGGRERSYVYHTLLVGRLVATKFMAKDGEAVMAALLHDSVEDQSEKLEGLLHLPPGSGKQAIIEKLSEYLGLGGKADEQKGFKYYLNNLTNPDFNALLSKHPIDSHVLHEINYAKEKLQDYPALKSLEEHKNGDKILLYVSHVIQIIEKKDFLSVIKMADFLCNGLHLHLTVDNPIFSPEQRAKWHAKYEPVAHFLRKYLTENKDEFLSLLGKRGYQYISNKARDAAGNEPFI